MGWISSQGILSSYCRVKWLGCRSSLPETHSRLWGFHETIRQPLVSHKFVGYQKYTQKNVACPGSPKPRWWLIPPSEKYVRQIGSWNPSRDKNKKCLKPPPSKHDDLARSIHFQMFVKKNSLQRLPFQSSGPSVLVSPRKSLGGKNLEDLLVRCLER